MDIVDPTIHVVFNLIMDSSAASELNRMAWLYLGLACVFEVCFTTTLRFVAHLKDLWAIAGVLACLSLSLLFVELAKKNIPLGTAYSIWTGTGAAGTVVIGMVWFGESASLPRVLLIMGVAGCAIGLSFTGGK